jgi:hypothetical protein
MPRLTKKKGGMVRLPPESELWEPLACPIGARAVDCVFNTLVLLGVLSVEEAHMWSPLFTKGVPTLLVKTRLEGYYPDITFTLLEYNLSPAAPIQAAFADILPRLQRGYAYYSAYYWPPNEAHASILYINPEGVLILVDPQVKQELIGIDNIITYLASIGTTKIELIVPNQETPPRVNIKQSVQQLRIKKLLYDAAVLNGVPPPTAMNYARAGITDALTLPVLFGEVTAADLLTAPFAVPFQKLSDLHQQCLGTPLAPSLAALPDSIVVYATKEVYAHTIPAAMMILEYRPDEHTMILWSVCTDFAFRKQGIFKQLLQYADTLVPTDVTRYRLYCETATKGYTTFQDRFRVYSKIGFQLPLGTVVRCTLKVGNGKLNIARDGVITGSEGSTYSVQFGTLVKVVNYTQLIAIVSSENMSGTSVLMEADRAVVQGFLAPGAGHAGGTRKKRSRKHTRRKVSKL